MTDDISAVSTSQRRIRHLRSVAGRNIAWCGESHNNTEFRVPTGSLSSSVSSSVVTSRAPSPELQYSSSLGARGSVARSPMIHRRTGSDGLVSPEGGMLQPAPYPSVSALPTGMRRSESVSSMQSCSSATVEDSSMTKSAYKLSRSKKSLLKRNAVAHKEEESYREERGLLDIYMTLQLSASEPAFYKSETIPNTINPMFKALDPLHWEWYDGVQTTVVARMWARHSFPESAALASSLSDNDDNVYSEQAHHKSKRPSLLKEEFQLLIEWQVDLNALAFIGKALQDIPATFPENTIIFEFDDGFYTAPDIANILIQSKRSSTVDAGSDANDYNETPTNKSKRSYTYNHIVRLNTLKDCIFDTQKSVDDVRQQVEDILTKEENRFRLARECSQRQIKLEDTERFLVQKKNEIRKQRQRIAELKKTLNERELSLKQSSERLKASIEDLKESESLLDRNVHMHQKLFNQLNRLKKELIADLFSIYPIEQISLDDAQQFRIRGIHLPNSVYAGCDEEMIATALGFTAHLVSMLAFYLEIPLRYPIVPMGSRATIKDPISLLNGAKEFPLYSKGVDKYRFEFGVFLLNKNIEQMMNAYGLIVMDLRHTLPNIHYFIQAILTTSVSAVPSSISVLSISSYTNQPGGDNCKPKRSRLREKLGGKSKRDSSSKLATASDKTPSISNSIKIANGHKTAPDHHDDDHHYPHHLTLQPVLYDSSVAPSPSTSNTSSAGHNVSVTNSPKISSSPNLMSKAAIISSSQPIAAPPTLETVTTNSSCNRAEKKNGVKSVGKS